MSLVLETLAKTGGLTPSNQKQRDDGLEEMRVEDNGCF